jgi:hypothetical protein
MRALRWYLGWEIAAIHALTGLLFALINGLLLRAMLPDHWAVVLALLPLTAFSWWGFLAEARFVVRASRAFALDDRPHDLEQAGLDAADALARPRVPYMHERAARVARDHEACARHEASSPVKASQRARTTRA